MKNTKHGKIYQTLRAVLLIIGGLLLVCFMSFRPTREPKWGVSFSVSEASYLGFDWQKMYTEILGELQPKYLRTMAYWELIQPEKDKFNFSEIDRVLLEAKQRGIQVILVVGRKQPGWPECHEPEWVRSLDSSLQRDRLMEYIQKTVERYRGNESVSGWQVENEPFFAYGPHCAAIPRELFEEELALVKSLDSRPIIVTDSGEKGAWLPTAWAGGDIFGSTMYRNIYHDRKQKYIKYPIPPVLYRLKAGLTKVLSGADKFIGVELQAEPWFATNIFETSWEAQAALMNPAILKEYVDYAKRVGFGENYFWGVEWWYWARSQGHPEMWEAAKLIFNSQ